MNVWNDFAKPVVVLGSICVLTGALLAVTHSVTQPMIDANAIATANAARAELLPEADTFTENTSVAVDGVTEIYVADNGAGAVITAEAGGYGGPVPVMVAFNADGVISAVKFLDNSETPGLGQKVKDEAFSSQFAGKPASELTLGTDITAIAGVTISSRAATNAVNYAIEAYAVLNGAEQTAELTEEEVLAAVLPDGGALTPVETDVAGVTAAYEAENGGMVIQVEGVGYHDKPMIAIVGFDAQGVITGVWTNGMNEGEPVREALTGFDFGAGAVGSTDLSGVDGVAGATGSSDLMKQTIQMALDAYQAVKGA